MKGKSTGATLLMRHSGFSYGTCSTFIRTGIVSMRIYQILAPLADRLGVAYVKPTAALNGVQS